MADNILNPLEALAVYQQQLQGQGALNPTQQAILNRNMQSAGAFTSPESYTSDYEPQRKPAGEFSKASLDTPTQPTRRFFGKVMEDPRVALRRSAAQSMADSNPELVGKEDTAEWWTTYAKKLNRIGDLGGTIEALGQASSIRNAQQRTSKEAKAPTTRNIREGKEIVNQEWNPSLMKWIEVGRGPVGSGMEININNKEQENWARVHDRYEKSMKDIVEKRSKVEEIRATTSTPGGASAQALQTSIADLFGGQSRAVAELERWATFGNLPDRVINSATRFLKGEYSEGAEADVLQLLDNYEEQVLNKQHTDINKRYEKVAEAAKVPLEFFIRDVPEKPQIDIQNMSLEDILNMDIKRLNNTQRMQLEQRLNDLGV